MRASPDPPAQQLQAFLDHLSISGYAVAKAPDLWHNLQRGGDWDLVVGDIYEAHRALVQIVGTPQHVDKHSYVWCSFYDWGEIDLLPELSWRGLTLVPGQRLVQGRRLNVDGIYEARPAHQAMAAVIQPLLAWGMYKPRYEPVWDTASREDTVELKACLIDAFGKPIANDLCAVSLPSSASARILRRAAVRRSARRPVRTAINILRFTTAEIRVRSSRLTAE